MKFTQEVAKTNDPTYTSPSREPDRLRADRSLETLFAGIGDAVTGVAGVIDQGIRSNIEREAYEGVDPIRDSQGVTAAITTEGDLWGTKATPAGAPITLNRPPAGDDPSRSVRTLTEAFNAGKIGPTQYYSRLEVLSRQMRTRYPGYRGEVDKTIQSITGINPANAIVRQVHSELEEQRRAANSARDDVTKRVQRAIDGGSVPMSVVDRYNKGEASPEEVLYHAAQFNRESSVQTEINKRVEYLSKTGGDWKNVAEQGASNIVESVVDNTIFKAADSQKLFNTARSMVAEGRIPTPDEKAQLTAGLAAMKTNLAMAVDQSLHNPVLNVDGTKMSYASRIGPEAARRIKEQAMQRVDALEQMVNNGQYGLVAATARDIKARKEHSESELLRDPFIGVLAGLPESVKDYLGPIFEREPGFQKDLVGAVQTRLAIARSGKGASFSEGIDQLRKTNNKEPDMWKREFNAAVNGIVDPKAPPEVRKNHVKSLFSDKELGVLGKFKPEQGATVFSTLASPQVTQAIKSMNDAEAWGMYEGWVRNSFDRLLTTQFQSLGKATSVTGADYTLKWDGVQLRPEMSEIGMKKWNDSRNPFRMYNRDRSGEGDAPDFSRVMGHADWKALNDINLAIRTLGPVITAGGSGNLEQIVMQTFLSKSPPKPDSTMGKIRDVFQEIQDAEAAEAKAKETGTSTKDSAQDNFRRSRSQPKPEKQSTLDFDNATSEMVKPVAFAPSERSSRRDGPLDFDNAKLVDDAKIRAGVDMSGVEEPLRNYGVSLSEKWGIDITSGHRDPFRNRAVGGANNSQHLHGNALDFSLKRLPVEDRMALIDDILRDPRVGGIGMYDDGSIHVDFRKDGKAAWGSDRSTLDGTPSWFRQRVERWRGKDI